MSSIEQIDEDAKEMIDKIKSLAPTISVETVLLCAKISLDHIMKLSVQPIKYYDTRMHSTKF